MELFVPTAKEKREIPLNELARVHRAQRCVNFDRRIAALRAIYTPRYAFPEWKGNVSEPRLRTARVFYHKEDNLDLVKLVAEHREPANFSMVRHYKVDALEEQFGWPTSYYQFYYNTSTNLAPNFATYTHAKVLEANVDVDILHAIGFAMDNAYQPDCLWLMAQDKRFRTKILKTWYVNMFSLIFAAAVRLKKTGLVMSLVGAEGMAKLYQKGAYESDVVEAFKQEVWRPALFELATRHPNMMLYFMDSKDEADMFDDYYNKHTTAWRRFGDLGEFPELLSTEGFKFAEKNCDLLFINACSPHTVLGNGNAMDRTIDGRIGRCTDIAVIGSPRLNPFIRYVAL